MLDKSKYASHGAFLKRISDVCHANYNKPKLGIFKLI